MKLIDVELVTDQLVLKPISMQYKHDIFLEFTHEISLYMVHCPAQKIAETEAWIQQSLTELKQGKSLPLVILKRGTGEFLGCVGLHALHQDNPAFRIWLKRSAHGHRYGLQAVAALKHWAEEHLEYQTLRYPVDRINRPSRSIPEALGAIQSKEYKLLSLSRRVLDVVEYVMPKSNTSIKRKQGVQFLSMKPVEASLCLSAST